MTDVADVRVAVTGASSFTALWICKALTSAGYFVDALLHQPIEHYAGVQKERLRILKDERLRLHVNLAAEKGDFEDWIKENKPTVWIHHHHHMENFRDHNYDLAKADLRCVRPLNAIIKALAENGCRRLIYSGSYLENDPDCEVSFAQNSPYAQSKQKVWQSLLRLSRNLNLPISKIVIPNPIGPLENADRLIPTLIRKSIYGGEVTLVGHNRMAINLPVDRLAQEYLREVEESLKHSVERIRILQPRVEGESTYLLARRALKAIVATQLCNRPCPVFTDDAIQVDEQRAAVDGEVSEFWYWYADVLKLTGMEGVQL